MVGWMGKPSTQYVYKITTSKFKPAFTTLLRLLILFKMYPYNYFMMTVSIIVLVSTFLCTRNLGPEEVSVTAV